MTDEPAGRGDVETDEQRPGGSASANSGRRPSPGRTPGAAAASRARRIGGNTRRGAQPAPSASTENGEGVRNEPPTGSTRSRRARDEASTSPTVSFAKRPDEQSTDRPPAPAPAAAAAPSSRLRWLPALVLTLAALAMAAFFAVESHGVWWARPSANAVRDQVLAAAKTCVVAANSYSYQDFDTAEQKGAACTTGPQTQRYRNAMNQLKPKATKLKATQVAQVNAAGVAQISQDGSQWTVLVFGQLSVHATQTGPKGRIDPFGAVVRMDHVDGEWLMSSIEPISSQPG